MTKVNNPDSGAELFRQTEVAAMFGHAFAYLTLVLGMFFKLAQLGPAEF